MAANPSTSAPSKVWDKREFQNLDNTRELGTRNIKDRDAPACAVLPAMAQLKNSILTAQSTAQRAKAGWTFKCAPNVSNAIKVLLMLDVGGSMDPFIKLMRRTLQCCH